MVELMHILHRRKSETAVFPNSTPERNELSSFLLRYREPLSEMGDIRTLSHIILSKVSQIRKPKIVCSPSYADFRSRANPTRGLDFDHMIK
jgi:hypothetical protein